MADPHDRSALAASLGAALRAKHQPPTGWPDGALGDVSREVLQSAVSDVEDRSLAVAWTTWTKVAVPVGESHHGAWLDIVELIQGMATLRVEQKVQAPGWAPVLLEGGKRHDDNVRAIYALALDCDDHGDWTRLLAVLRGLGLAYIAHRTPTHGENGACKWRLVLPLAGPVDASEIGDWKESYTVARVILGAAGGVWFDPSCSNPSRFWFHPVFIGNAPPRDVCVEHGVAFDLRSLCERGKALLASGAAQAPLLQNTHVPSPPTRGNLRPVMSALDRAKRWLEKRDPAIQGSGGDQHTFVTASQMVTDFDLSAGEALEAMRDWNARCQPPWTESELEAKIANAIKYSTGQRGAALQSSLPSGSGASWRPSVDPGPPPNDRWGPVPDDPAGGMSDDPSSDPSGSGSGSGSVTTAGASKGKKPKLPRRINWPRLTQNGGVVTCLENTEAMLAHYGVLARYNLMTHEEEYTSPAFSGAADRRQNAALAQIREWARQHHMAVSALDDHLNLLVTTNPYHPVADFIKSAPWDGRDRISEMFQTFRFGPISDAKLALYRSVFTAWMVTAAHAALVPHDAREGIAAQLVLILQGPQGVCKTRWIKSLVPPDSGWAREGISLDPANRDSVQQATNVWIGEIGEIDATFRKADIALLKAFITSRTDTYRAAFARKAETVARRTVYAATVNEKGVLRDDTGSRRFAVMSVESANPDHGIDLQQLWAQAASMPEEARFLGADTERDLLVANKDHEQIDPIYEMVALTWSADTSALPHWHNLKEILEEIDSERKWTTADGRSVARVVRNQLGARERVFKGYSQFAVVRCRD